MMTQEEQTQAFADDLENLVWRYIEEFDLTSASVVGALELVKSAIVLKAFSVETE